MTALPHHDDRAISIQRDAERDAEPVICPGCNEPIDERADGSLVSERYQGEDYHDYECYVLGLERDAEAGAKAQRELRYLLGEIEAKTREMIATANGDRDADYTDPRNAYPYRVVIMHAHASFLRLAGKSAYEATGLMTIPPDDWRER